MKQLISFYCFPDRHSYHRTDNRSHNKQPELADSLHTGKQCRANATGRINRCPRNGNTYNMHQDQSQSDSQPGKMRTAIIAVGSAQYSQHKDKRKHRFGNKCSQQYGSSKPLAPVPSIPIVPVINHSNAEPSIPPVTCATIYTPASITDSPPFSQTPMVMAGLI